MYQSLFQEFMAGPSTFQVFEGDKLVFASYQDNLLPLVEYVDKFAFVHREVVIFDKVMGRAAALLCVKANCREVFSPLGSQLAVEALDKYGIKHHLTKIVPFIQKPNRENMCPMEKLSMGKEPEEFYEAIKTTIP